MLKVFIFLFFYSLAVNSVFSQTGGKKLYETHCAACHNGALKEAPNFKSLQNFSQVAILKALQTGVMKVQGATISTADKKAIAQFISSKSEENKVILGKCGKQNQYKLQKSVIANWGMGLQNQRYITDNVLINKENVSKLEVDWVFAFPDANCARVQPTIAGNALFIASQNGLVYALDRKTGCIQWTFQADSEVRSSIILGKNKSGLVDKIYFADQNANVYCVDILKNKLVWKTKADNHLVAHITGSMAFANGILYVPVSSSEVISAYNSDYQCCTFRGSVLAIDSKNGNIIWKTYTVDNPKPTTKNAIGVQNFGPSGAPVWSNPTLDLKRKRIYIGTGENYSRPATATSDAIIALDMSNGKIIWTRQTIEQDAWNAGCVSTPKGANCPENNGPDFDFGAPPILVKMENGSDMLLAGQKSGIVFGLNPDDGQIIWQKQVSRGGIMGGIHWGMAADSKTLYVPINDHDVYEKDKNKPAKPGIHAIDILNGSTVWSVIEKNICEKVPYVCDSGISAAITLVPGLVFGSSLDGRIHTYDSEIGKKLWEFDTNREFDTVNNVKGSGGTIDSTGPVIVGNQLFINSGYAKFGEKAGNVLVAFKIKN